MAAFEGLVTFGSGVSQETKDKVFGAQGGIRTIPDVVDSLMLNSGAKETILVDFVTGRVIRVKVPSKLETIIAETEPEILEAFSVIDADADKRSPRWNVQNRTRSVSVSGGIPGVSDALDPIQPGVSLPTLLGRLETAGVGACEALMISQEDAPSFRPVVGVDPAGVGAVAVISAAALNAMFNTSNADYFGDADVEVIEVARDESEEVTLRDQVFE